jgi:hypothetical protein
MPDIRSYNNPFLPSYSEGWQNERLTGEVYVEGKSGFDALLRSIRKGTIVEVADGFLLAPITGKPATRRTALLDRVDAIKAKGGILHEVATGHRSNNRSECNRMLLRAYEMIATSGRGRKSAQNGRLSKNGGRPRKKYEPDQLELMERIWFSRRYKSRDEAINAIRAKGIKVKRGWLYNHFGPPDRKPDDET